jgi:cell division protein ftsL
MKIYRKTETKREQTTNYFSKSNVKKDSVKKGKFSSNIVSISVCAFVIMIMIGTGIKFVNQGLTLMRLQHQKVELEKNITEEKKTIEELKKDLLNAETPEYLEKQAREQLKMVKPNERVYIDLERKQ